MILNILCKSFKIVILQQGISQTGEGGGRVIRGQGTMEQHALK